VRPWGIQTLYPQGDTTGGYDWGAIAVWAWGGSRAIDFLLADSGEGGLARKVRSDALMAIGHSRAGKTALWMAALDQRVRAVFPLMSGEGGCGAMRVRSPCNDGTPESTPCDHPTQDVAQIYAQFPYWFGSRGMAASSRSGYGNFSMRERHAPWDEHWQMALVAPRAQIGFNGLANQHENPVGSQAAYTAAREVYAWLGVPERLGIHFHAGAHPMEAADWPVVADFADFVLAGKAPANATEFTAEAYALPKQFIWSAPPELDLSEGEGGEQ
jgi:hypothetical protein